MQQEFQTYLASKDCEVISGRIKTDRLIQLEQHRMRDWMEIRDLLTERGYWLRFHHDGKVLHTTFNLESCADCQACKPSRLSIPDFKPTERQQELLNTISLKISIVDTPNPFQHSELAARYQKARHGEEDSEGTKLYWMHRKKITRCMEFRNEDNKLVAGLLFQIGQELAIGDYYYYEPQAAVQYHNIVMFMQLKLLEHLNEISDQKTKPLTHLYLGSWSIEPSALSHKARLRGLEILEDGNWRALTRKEQRKAMSQYFKAYPPEIPSPL